jgi:hypothetical protein
MEKNTLEKKKALDCIWYELWMFDETFKRLSSESQVEKNVYLESFLAHLRNIIDFLQDEKYESDIKISDYNLNIIEIVLPSSNTYSEINKRLSHLTWERVFEEKIVWRYGEIKEEINKKSAIFLENVSEEFFPTHQYNKTKNDFYLLIK